MRQLKYSFEYFCSPIWINENINPNSIFENIDIDLLPISRNLKEKIIELDGLYQLTFNDEYPPEPIIMDETEAYLFKLGVISSANQLSEELKNEYEILFDRNHWN